MIIMPDKRGIITTSWDDGFYLDMKLAGLLDKYSLKGTFYIPQKFTDKPLKKSQIRALAKRHEIGAHSLTHRDLTRLNYRALCKEINDSKCYLEDIIQKEVKMFAYPLGRFNAQVKKAVKSANFLGARTINDLNAKEIDPWAFGVTLGTNLSRMSLKHWFGVACLSAHYSLTQAKIWHLTGHSWEIEQFNLWGTLERLFAYLQRLRNKICLVNSEVIQK